jgi:hypothetical protein
MIASDLRLGEIAYDAAHPQVRRAAPETPLPWHASWGLRLLLIFVVWIWIQSLWAVQPDDHLDGAILFTKYLVLCAVLFTLLRDERALTLFAWAHVLGCFLWGWIAFQSNVSGRFEVVLEPSVDDSNLLGFHLTTGLAMSGFLFLTSGKSGRILALITLPFILNTIILTASRSALIGLIAAGAASVLLAPKRQRFVVVTSGLLGCLLLTMLAKDDLFWSRVATLQVTERSEMDASVTSRIAVADANWQMFLDHPFGVGHKGNAALSPDYMPLEILAAGKGPRTRAAHNTLLAVLVDQGFPGFLLFISLIVWAAVKLLQLRKLDHVGLPTTLGGFRAAIGAGLAAYVAAGQFVNLLKVEVFFWLLALVAVLDVQCAKWKDISARQKLRQPIHER